MRSSNNNVCESDDEEIIGQSKKQIENIESIKWMVNNGFIIYNEKDIDNFEQLLIDYFEEL